ncbi:hypothetical protein, partial [Burkholderia stabilis]
ANARQPPARITAHRLPACPCRLPDTSRERAKPGGTRSISRRQHAPPDTRTATLPFSRFV